MTGRIIVNATGPIWRPHPCEPPSPVPTSVRLVNQPWRIPAELALVGAVWRCDCGQHWECQDSNGGVFGWWDRISDRRAMRILNRIAKRAAR